MVVVLAILLAINAILHALIVVRFGARGNIPFAAYIVVYAALALAVLLDVPHAIRATLLLAIAGWIGLTIMFRSLDRDRTVDRMIWVLDLATVLVAAYMLFVA